MNRRGPARYACPSRWDCAEATRLAHRESGSFSSTIVCRFSRVALHFAARPSCASWRHAPRPGEIEVSGHCFEIGFVCEFEVRGAMTDRCLGLGDERLRSPERRRETDERPQKSRPIPRPWRRKEPGSRTHEASRRGGRHASSSRSPATTNRQGNGRHANSTRGEQVDHEPPVRPRQRGRLDREQARRGRARIALRPASLCPGSSSGRTNHPRRGSTGRATPPWPSRRGRRTATSHVNRRGGASSASSPYCRSGSPAERSSRACRREARAVRLASGISCCTLVATAQQIPETHGQCAAEGQERPQSGRAPIPRETGYGDRESLRWIAAARI